MRKKPITPRKRPRQERSQATVEAILQAATYILTRRGWSAFTTNEVATRAGVNIASLYQYFPNKEAIVAELQRRHIAEVEARCPDPPAGLSLHEYLRGMVETVVAEHRVSPALHRVFAEELPRESRLGKAPHPAQARWASHVAERANVPDLELASFITHTAAHAIIHEAATHHPELLAHPLFVDELTRLLGSYLAGR